MAKKTNPPPASVPDDDKSALAWAESVMWAAENVNTPKMTLRKAGSLSKFTYWKHGRENPDDLLVTLAPKAAAILNKNKVDDKQSEIEEQENLSIKELEELLTDAIKDSQDS